MVTIKSPAELAATVRKVAKRLPSHYFAETRDLIEAAGLLEKLGTAAETTRALTENDV
jgi:hypothetical protein